MSESLSSIHSKDRKIKWKKYALAPLIVLGSVGSVALYGHLNDEPKETGPVFPGLPAQKSGVGDKSLKLKLDQAAKKGPGAHQLIVGIRMDCDESSERESIAVSVDGAINGFKTHDCDDPQPILADIPPSHPLYTANSVTVHIDASKPDLKWDVGVGTKK